MPMLPGFGGRLGRLAFLGWSIAFGVFLTALTMALVFAFLPRHADMSAGSVLAVVLIVAPIFLYGTLMLQARRIRDIGWSPLAVLLGWMAVDMLDVLLAHLSPALAVSGGGTGLGVVVNFLMAVVLLFWPGSPEDRSWGSGDHLEAEPRQPRPAATVMTARVPARAQPAPVATGFGRRRL